MSTKKAACVQCSDTNHRNSSPTWLTWGVTEAKSKSRSRCLSRKFETPMARTLSSSNNSSNVRQALSIWTIVHPNKDQTYLFLTGTWPVQQEQIQIVGAQKPKTFGDRLQAATWPVVLRPDLGSLIGVCLLGCFRERPCPWERVLPVSASTPELQPREIVHSHSAEPCQPT